MEPVTVAKLLYKFRKPLMTFAIGFTVFIVVIFVLVLNKPSFDGSLDDFADGNKDLSEEVLRWKPLVEKYAQEYGGSQYVPYILALMQIESGGRGGDPMQSSESLGLPPNTIQDPNKSIQQGVKYFIENMKSAEKKGADVKTALQAYNYGGGYVDYAVANGGGKYSFETAKAFSKNMAHGVKVTYINEISTKLGYDYRYNYGNMFYVPKLMEYVVEGSSGGTVGGAWGWPFPGGRGNFASFQIFGTHPGGEFRANGFHDGLDFGSIDHPGREIRAVHGGTVVFTGNPHIPGLGAVVVVIRDGGYNFVYQEFANFSNGSNVIVGQKVKTGQVIGFRDTDHLHLGITKTEWRQAQASAFTDNGVWLDPLKMIENGIKANKK